MPPGHEQPLAHVPVAHQPHPEEHGEHHNPAHAALEAGHVADAGFSLLEGASGLARHGSTLGNMIGHGSQVGNALHAASPFMAGFGGVLSAGSMIGGAYNLGQAIGSGDGAGSQGSQGALDVVSGGLGVANAGMFLAGAACPPLAIAAGAAGLGAFGNEWAEHHGMYGQHTNAQGGQENATFLNSIGDRATQGWDAGHNLLGNNIAGDALGAVAGGIGGAGQTVYNAGAAITGGVARAGEAVWNFLSDERLKTEIEPISGALDLLARL